MNIYVCHWGKKFVLKAYKKMPQRCRQQNEQSHPGEYTHEGKRLSTSHQVSFIQSLGLAEWQQTKKNNKKHFEGLKYLASLYTDYIVSHLPCVSSHLPCVSRHLSCVSKCLTWISTCGAQSFIHDVKYF